MFASTACRRHVREHVEQGSNVYTDALHSYHGLTTRLRASGRLTTPRHTPRGNVHTNGLECYWCALEACLRGTYISVEPFHLFRYLDEQAFRFNQRVLE